MNDTTKSKWWYFGQSAYRVLIVILLTTIALQLSEVIVLLTRLDDGFGV